MTKIATETRIRIALDAQADMHAIDRADEADDFAGAWLGAVRGLAEALGLADCEGFRAPAGSPAEADGCTVTEIAGDESTVEAVLWQAAHDLCSRDAEAAPGDRWQWSEPSAQTVERLRRRLRLAPAPDGARIVRTVEIFWDDQDSTAEGWAYRVNFADGHEESGAADGESDDGIGTLSSAIAGYLPKDCTAAALPWKELQGAKGWAARVTHDE